jgi:hypothetical protein
VEHILLTTSHNQSFLTEILEGKPIPAGKLAYFRARLRYALHDLVLREFVRQEDAGKINKAQLARRIGRKPEQVSRWLGAPGNWTIDTVSDLLIGMAVEPGVRIVHFDQITPIASVQAAAKPTANSESHPSQGLQAMAAPVAVQPVNVPDEAA